MLVILTGVNHTSGGEVRGFVRGDCNGDGIWSITDVNSVINYLFLSAPRPDCLDSCDLNDDGVLTLSDALHGLENLFLGGPRFPSPHECGVDPTSDSLDCRVGTCRMGVLIEERAFTLETARVGLTYRGDFPANFQEELFWQEFGGTLQVYQDEIRYTRFGFPLDEDLPSGLRLDPETGVVTGEPSEAGFHKFRILARHPNRRFVLYHVDMAVFRAEESEFVSNQPFDLPGPFTTEVHVASFDFHHQLPWPLPYPLYG